MSKSLSYQRDKYINDYRSLSDHSLFSMGAANHLMMRKQLQSKQGLHQGGYVYAGMNCNGRANLIMAYKPCSQDPPDNQLHKEDIS